MAELRHLFVYGTLRPGEVRWPFLEPFVLDEGTADSVHGQLFDTGFDYPAACRAHRSHGSGLGRFAAHSPTAGANCA